MEIHEEEHILRCTEMFNQYEQMLESLSQNVQFYQEEVQTLKGELNHFVQQNKELSVKLQEERKANIELEGFKERSQFENNIINSLKDQLESTLQENRTITELWQSSLKTIDCLEQELNIYRGDNEGLVSQRYLKCEKEKYDKELQSLHSDLQNLQVKLKETIQLHTDALRTKNEELYLVSEENKNVKQQINDFKNEMNELRKRQIGLDSIQERFTNILNEKLRQIDNLKKNEAAIKIKMNEALVVAERAVVERDTAILRENTTRNEVEKLSQYFEENRKEMDLNMTNQLKNLENLYEEKRKGANEEIKLLKDELATKSLELDKFKNECEILHEEVKRIKQGNSYIDETNTSRLLILEKNMEATFQRLLISEKKGLQLAAERDSVKADLEQMINMYHNDMKSKEIEKTSMQKKIIALQNELEMNRNNVMVITEKLEKLGTELDKLTVENKKSLHAKDQRNQKTINEMKEMQEKFERIQDITKRHLDLQQEINKKWQKGIEETTRKFEERIHELKKEIRHLKTKNDHLEQALLIANAAMEEYKKFYDQMCGVAQNIAEIADASTET